MEKKLLVLFAFACFQAIFAQSSSVLYQYDNLNRLTRVEYNDGQVIQFTYDAVGNRTAHVITTSGQPAPVISSFQPQSGPISTEVTITGDNFTGTTQVAFNGVASSYTVDSNIQIRATTPESATTGKLTVMTPNGIATSSSDFTVTTSGNPILRTPIYPIVFGTVDVGGNSEQSTTIYNDGSGTLTISGVTKTYGVDDYTVITSLPLNIGPNSSGPITVRFSPTSFGSKTETFKLTNNDPNNQNAQFNVAGQGGYEQPPDFPLPVQAETMVGVGLLVPGVGRKLTTPDSPQQWYIFQQIPFPQAGWLHFDVIARAEWQANNEWPKFLIKYTDGAQEVNSTDWQTYRFTKYLGTTEFMMEINIDEITRQTPGHSIIVDSTIISYFEPQPVLYVNPITLDFGDTETQLTFDISNVGDGTLEWSVATSNSWIPSLSPPSGQDNGTVTVNVNRAGLPLGAHQGIVAVTSNGGNLGVTINMTVTQLIPVISSFAPTSGLVGTEVIITGNNFVNVSEVAFNGFSTPIFSVDSDTQIRAEVPLGASSGKITVTTSGGTATSENDFNVTVETVIVFADNFNRADIGGADWQIAGSAASIINYPPDGKLQLNAVVAGGVKAYLTAAGTQLVDAIFVFDFDNGPEARSVNATHIYLRYIDSETYYYLDISEDNYQAPSRQNVTLRRKESGTLQELYFLEQTLLDPGRYEFSALGNQIKFRNISGGTNINFSVIDNGISSAGKVGFLAGWETTTFDNVVLSSPLSIVETKICLEGPYDGANDVMTMALSTGGSIPTISPYSEDPRSVTSIPADITDWVLVQLRSTADGAAVASKSAFLHKDGRIVADDGTTGQITMNVADGDYYIVIKHRNHLAVMSANPVTLNSSSSTLYDFTIGSSQYYGSGGAKELEPNVWGMWSGDINQDGQTTTSDFTQWFNSARAGDSGYQITDVNLDAQVTTSDFTKWFNNARAGASSGVP